MSRAQQLHHEAFSVGRDQRSDEYKAGALAALQFNCGETRVLQCPHEQGSVQADAWFAGSDEGRAIYKRSQVRS